MCKQTDCVVCSSISRYGHSPLDKVVAVMGMDVTLGYFHKLLATSISACSLQGVR